MRYTFIREEGFLFLYFILGIRIVTRAYLFCRKRVLLRYGVVIPCASAANFSENVLIAGHD